MYKIKHLDGEITVLNSDSEFIHFMIKIAIENDDEDIAITCLHEAMSYFEIYCDNLILGPKPNTKVILELYMEIWFCYEDGQSMNTPYFTSTSYIEIEQLCSEFELDIIQIIDMSEID